MKLISRYFSFENADDRWDRMANVLRKSCDAHGVKHDIQQMETPQRTRGPSIVANHAKLKEWRDVALAESEPVILADADIFLQRDPSEVFGQVSDIGITYRDQEGGPPLPLNAGIVFVQPTRIGKQFLRDWCKWDDLLYEDPVLLSKWVRHCGGLNQGSLGALLYTGQYQPTRLNCSEWNLVEPWDNWQDAAIVHVKGSCMTHIFDGQKSKYESVSEIKNRWEAIENHIT